MVKSPVKGYTMWPQDPEGGKPAGPGQGRLLGGGGSRWRCDGGQISPRVVERWGKPRSGLVRGRFGGRRLASRLERRVI